MGRRAFPGFFQTTSSQNHSSCCFVLRILLLCFITFLFLAWDKNNLLFASFPFLFFSAHDLLVSGRSFDPHLVHKQTATTRHHSIMWHRFPCLSFNPPHPHPPVSTWIFSVASESLEVTQRGVVEAPSGEQLFHSFKHVRIDINQSGTGPKNLNSR